MWAKIRDVTCHLQAPPSIYINNGTPKLFWFPHGPIWLICSTYGVYSATLNAWRYWWSDRRQVHNFLSKSTRRATRPSRGFRFDGTWRSIPKLPEWVNCRIKSIFLASRRISFPIFPYSRNQQWRLQINPSTAPTFPLSMQCVVFSISHAYACCKISSS